MSDAHESDVPNLQAEDLNTQGGELNYESARLRAFVQGATTTVRILGTSIADTESFEGYTAILYRGMYADGVALWETRERLWHLPESKLTGASGRFEGGGESNEDIYWFEIEKDAAPIEEVYSRLSIGGELRKLTTLAGASDAETARHGVLAARLGDLLLDPLELSLTEPPEPIARQKKRPRQVVVVANGMLTEATCGALRRNNLGECRDVDTAVNTAPPGQDEPGLHGGFHSNIPIANDTDAATEITVY